MSERRPDFYLIKKDDRYYNLATGHWEHDREYATRYSLPPLNISGKLVPVYVTVKKIKKGHSWSWACKRLLEGKKVTRLSWDDGYGWFEMNKSTVRVEFKRILDSGSIDKLTATMDSPNMLAKDWGLYDE